jgi:NAD dependent epimerase/dehydratase family enzyme
MRCIALAPRVGREVAGRARRGRCRSRSLRRSFFTRWRGDYYKREVLGSRRAAIQSLIDAIARASARPTVFVSTSSLGPYGFRRDDQVLTERSRPDIGPLSRDALELEACALKAEALGTRVVLLRPGIVLAPDGGALQLMTRAFARGSVPR